ncbi:hypothetical protein VKT23_014050 [Stygiomarasmius scandens]|uniref:F-box domain-containing protein n=1 Tax=Marasmiellus scandens TaxID=2682957 RepID=A0ABR1J4G5_9AGAR
MTILPRDLLLRLIDLFSGDTTTLKSLSLGLGPKFRHYIENYLFSRVKIYGSRQVEEMTISFRCHPHRLKAVKRVTIYWWAGFGQPNSTLDTVEFLNTLPKEDTSRNLVLSNFIVTGHQDEVELESVITIAMYRTFRKVEFQDCVLSKISWRDCLAVIRSRDMESVSLLRCGVHQSEQSFGRILEGLKPQLDQLYIESCSMEFLDALGGDVGFIQAITLKRLQVIDSEVNATAGRALVILLPLIKDDLVHLVCASRHGKRILGSNSVYLMFRAFINARSFPKLRNLSLSCRTYQPQGTYSLTIRVIKKTWSISFNDRRCFKLFVSSNDMGWENAADRVEAAAECVNNGLFGGIQFSHLLNNMFDTEELREGALW